VRARWESALAGVADREAEGGISVLDLGAERVVRDPLDERPRCVEDRARAPYLVGGDVPPDRPAPERERGMRQNGSRISSSGRPGSPGLSP